MTWAFGNISRNQSLGTDPTHNLDRSDHSIITLRLFAVQIWVFCLFFFLLLLLAKSDVTVSKSSIYARHSRSISPEPLYWQCVIIRPITKSQFIPVLFSEFRGCLHPNHQNLKLGWRRLSRPVLRWHNVIAIKFIMQPRRSMRYVLQGVCLDGDLKFKQRMRIWRRAYTRSRHPVLDIFETQWNKKKRSALINKLAMLW